MSSFRDLLRSIRESARSPNCWCGIPMSHRTAQRWIRQLIIDGRITGIGEGRARRYLAAKTAVTGKSMYRPLSAPQQIKLALDVMQIAEGC